MEERLSSFMREISDRFDSIERRLDSSGQRPEFLSGSATNATDTEEVATGSAQHFATGRNIDVQGEFAAIKDALSRIKLPADLKLNESRQGVKRTDQQTLNVLTRCSRYNETAIKLISTIAPGSSISQETLDQLLVICRAQCKYLQDEYASILVNGQFDASTSRIFRALQRNTAGLNPEALDTLRSAATLAAASTSQGGRRGAYQPSYQGPARGRGRGRGRPDIFNNFGQRSFPNSRFQRDDNSNSNTEVEM